MQLSTREIELITFTSFKAFIFIFLAFFILTMSEEELSSYKTGIDSFMLKLKGCTETDVEKYKLCFEEWNKLKDSEKISREEVCKVQVTLSEIKKEKEETKSLLEEGEWEELVCKEVEAENKLLEEDLKKKKVASIWLESKLRLDRIKFDQVLSQKTILINKLKIENQSLKYRIDFVKSKSFNSFELI